MRISIRFAKPEWQSVLGRLPEITPENAAKRLPRLIRACARLGRAHLWVRTPNYGDAAKVSEIGFILYCQKIGRVGLVKSTSLEIDLETRTEIRFLKVKTKELPIGKLKSISETLAPGSRSSETQRAQKTKKVASRKFKGD